MGTFDHFLSSLWVAENLAGIGININLPQRPQGSRIRHPGHKDLKSPDGLMTRLKQKAVFLSSNDITDILRQPCVRLTAGCSLIEFGRKDSHLTSLRQSHRGFKFNSPFTDDANISCGHNCHTLITCSKHNFG